MNVNNSTGTNKKSQENFTSSLAQAQPAPPEWSKQAMSFCHNQAEKV